MKKGYLAVLFSIIILLYSASLISAEMIPMGGTSKLLKVGDTWFLGGTIKNETYSLTVKSVEGGKVTLALNTDGRQIDSKLLREGETYEFIFNSTEFGYLQEYTYVLFTTKVNLISEDEIELKNSAINSLAIGSNTLPEFTVLQGSSTSAKKVLEVGESWEISGGYRVYLNSVDKRASPRQAWVTLTKDCVRVDDRVMEVGEFYNLSAERIDVLTIYIDSVFAGATTDMVQFRFTSIIRDADVYNPNTTKKENWSCSEWSECINGTRARNCTDSNNCGGEVGRPLLTEKCCSEDWQCSDWTECSTNQQIRVCMDRNNCGTTLKKPAQKQSCGLGDGNKEDKEIKKEGEKKNISKIGEREIITNLEVFEKESETYVSTKCGTRKLKILPDEASARAKFIHSISNIEIIEEECRALYLISGTAKARLLFIFPVLAEVEQKIDIESGEVVSVKKPWWAFLASGI